MATKAKAAPAAKAAKVTVSNQASGIVLKVAFPKLDDEGRKTLRRHLRKALRDKEAPQFRFHKIGTRWVFPTAKDVATARQVAKEIPSLNA